MFCICMNIDEREQKILDFWKEKEIFKKTLEATKNGKSFVFYDGPITVNAQPGIHHVEARVYKDIVTRYKTMQGFFVERKNGWDTHGLPVELQVEKKLGFKSKRDIEKYGVAKFNEECLKSVDELIPVFRQMTERIGYWVDMDDPYVTYKPEYIETLWWILKQIWDKSLLYKDFKVIPWCYRCGTGLSSHELAQGYQNIRENSVYVKFKVILNEKAKKLGVKKDTHILSWTTTPWTLPGNVALAINPKMVYVLAKKGDQNYILAKSRIKVLESNYEIINEFKGSDLIDVSYEPLFGVSELKTDKSYKVYGAEFVTEEDGTGIVHTAVMYGVDDFDLGNKYDLPKIHTVTEDGKFNNLVKGFEGKLVKNNETEKELIGYLKENRFLLKQETVSHDYPFCWRCKTPLLYYAKDSWFIKVSAIREKLLKANKGVNWLPGHLKDGRFGEWLKGAKDWAITRERYWGTPFPVWECSKCGKQKCVGSFEELGQEINDPHRPHIDNIELDCECGEKMKREPFVIDVWFDSGAMPFAQHHYPFKQKGELENLPFPADYISEAIDQTRGWFYTMLTISVLLGHSFPYKNVVCLGHVLDGKGEKMSKSKGNIILPNEIISKYGADALRWYFFTVNQPGDPKRFNEKDIRKSLSRLLLLENSFNFLKFYLNSNKKISPKDLDEINPNHILDRWLLIKLKQTQKEVTKELNQFEIVRAARKVDELIGDLSNNYIHWSRTRLKNNNNKKSVLILMKTIFGISKLIAPFAPFVAENIYQTFKNDVFSDNSLKESVHLENWQSVNDLTQEEEKIISVISTLNNFISLGLRARKNKSIRVRQPLSEIKLNFDFKNTDPVLIDVLKEELNVKKVSFEKEIKESTSWTKDSEGTNVVVLNIKIDDKLKLEGDYREILRNIQILRKKTELTPNDKIILYHEGLDPVIKRFEEELKENSGIDSFLSFETQEMSQEIILDGKVVKIAIKKI
jgi:isoleucyl-tRNA synthetase